MADTYLFFIDDTGTNRHNKFVLRGGFLIKVDDYINLFKDFLSLKAQYNINAQEIKWSDLTSALCLKSRYPDKTFESTKRYYYLQPFSVEKIKEFICRIFQLFNNYNYLVITTIAYGKPGHQDHFLYKAELQNLMQRAQHEMKSQGTNAILIYDSDNKEKERKFKEAYSSIRDADPFIKDYTNIIDTIFCENSSYASGVQFADFIVGIIAGALRDYEFSKYIYQNFLFNKVRKSSGFFKRIMGYGLLAIPTDNSLLNTEIREKLVNLQE